MRIPVFCAGIYKEYPMIIVNKKVSLSFPYGPERLGALQELLFFDIETTGFSGDRDSLYLIGGIWYDGESWQLTQWFCDCREAEPEILAAFFQFLSRFRVLVHFNGEGFDIPFLLKRCAALGVPGSFDSVSSVDIYRLVRPYKTCLGLESLKQKSIEAFLGIRREDRMSGGQLIPVYREYLVSKDPHLYRLLLLHNEEDLTGMPQILPVLSYHDFLKGPFSFENAAFPPVQDISASSPGKLQLSYEGCCPLPAPVSFSDGPYQLTLKNRRLLLSVSLLAGELRHFYPDFEHYYYLIYEDCAIHKSVGQYVERSARKKATARTCYTRVSGLFLPQPPLPDDRYLWDDCLQADYRTTPVYTRCTDSLFADSKTAVQYLEAVLASCLPSQAGLTAD